MGFHKSASQIVRNIYNSIGKYISTSSFLIEVNKGNVPGHFLVHKFAWSNQIAPEKTDIWIDAKASSGTAIVQADYSVLLVDN